MTDLPEGAEAVYSGDDSAPPYAEQVDPETIKAGAQVLTGADAGAAPMASAFADMEKRQADSDSRFRAGLAALQGQQAALRRAREKQIPGEQAALDKARGAMAGLRNVPQEDQQELPDPEANPDLHFRQMGAGTMITMMLASVLGGRGARLSHLAAAKAVSAGMDAYNKGERQAMGDAMARYKLSVQRILNHNDIVRDRNKRLMDLAQNNVSAFVNEASLLAKSDDLVLEPHKMGVASAQDYLKAIELQNRSLGASSSQALKMLGAMSKDPMGATGERYTNAVVAAANEAEAHIQNWRSLLKHSGETAINTPALLGQSEGGVFSDAQNWMARTVSEREAQSVQQLMAGLAKSIAILQLGGPQGVNQAYVDQVTKNISPQAGMPVENSLQAMAQARQDYERGVEVAIDKPYMDQPSHAKQVALLKRGLLSVQKAIPFTVDDVFAYREQNPKVDFNTWLFLNHKIDKDGTPIQQVGP